MMRTILIFSMILFMGCQTSKTVTQVIKSSCDTEIDTSKLPTCTPAMICTSEYKTIAIQVMDKEGTPVQFDDFSLKNLSTSKGVEIKVPGATNAGYIIAEDAMKDELAQAGHCIELSGWINEQLILQYSFLVGHDCCHVILLSGPETITI